MKSLDEIAAAFPRPRDDEPPGLRARIVTELRDHLECAWRRELLKTGDETEAERRVLARFGDPKRVARRLWLDAMQEKIMSQRILMFWSGLMAAACLAMGAFVYRVVEQSAEANRALIKNMQEANRELLAQARALNLALIERLDRPPRDEAGDAAPHAASDRPADASEGDRSGNWVALHLALVKDRPGGEPATGYKVKLSRSSGDNQATAIDLDGPTGADGRFDAGLLAPGQYDVIVGTPWDEWANVTVQVRPGKRAETVEIVCPGEALPTVNVSLDVDWPQDLRGRHLGILVRCAESPREVAGRKWNTPQEDESFYGAVLVTDQGIVLQNRAGWGNRAAERASEQSFDSSSGGWVSSNPRPEADEDVRQISMEGVTARPTSTLQWNGARHTVHVMGIAIIEPLEAYSNQRLLVLGPEGDATEITGEFEPGQPNPHLRIPISPARAANVRRVLESRPLRSSSFEPVGIIVGEEGQILGQAARGKPQTAQTLYEQGRRCELRGAAEQALDLYTKAIKADPKYSYAYISRSILRMHANELEKAQQDFAEAVRINPNHAATYYAERGDAWAGIDALDKAIADYSEAIRLAPNNPPVYQSRARVWMQKGERRKSVADYTEAIRLAGQAEHRGLYAPYAERAAIWTELGEIDKAIGDYTAAIGEGEWNVAARIARGNLWWKQSNLDKALQDFTEAVRHGGSWPEAHNALAWFLASADDRQYRSGKRAIEHAVRACQLSDWQNADFFDTLAAAHAEAGDFPLAAAWEAKVLEVMTGAKEKPGPAELKQTEERLELYRSGKPYREQVPPRAAKRDESS